MRQVRISFLTLLLWTCVAAAGVAEPDTRQVWELMDELACTPDQRTVLMDIRDTVAASRAVMRTASDTNLPPDLLVNANLDHAALLRVVNRRLDALLDDGQKAKLQELRAGKTSEAEDVQDGAEAPVAASQRLPPRPLQSDQEYEQQAAELRAKYARPAKEWPAPLIDDEVRLRYVEIGLLPPMPYPPGNPYQPAKAELGRKLFFEPRLSGSGQISCSSCHDADLGWTDGRTVSFGHARKMLARNAPTVLNAGHQSSLFWDGRAASLEQQAFAVLMNDDEMRSNEALVREALGRVPEYTQSFACVFGSSDITLDRVAQAIATFERTVTSRGNDFDAFLRGDTDALSDAAVRGLHLFRTTARCVNCHHGPTFSDGQFHNEGLTYYGRKFQDLGRYEITKNPEDVGKFKTPTLRNIMRTGPYMHLGLFELDGVLNMYNAGMPSPRPRPGMEDDPLFPKKSHLLKPLGLNKVDLADLRAFLESLTETRQRMRPPELPGEEALNKAP